jgi:hypothetical protein
MAECYRIKATPTLYPEGEYQEKLQRVNFTAVSANDTRHWFAKNRGQFQSAFGKIMPASLARVMLQSLTDGDDVEFPGVFLEYQFAQGFLFEWSPVYLVLPPIFFARHEST